MTKSKAGHSERAKLWMMICETLRKVLKRNRRPLGCLAVIHGFNFKRESRFKLSFLFLCLWKTKDLGKATSHSRSFSVNGGLILWPPSSSASPSRSQLLCQEVNKMKTLIHTIFSRFITTFFKSTLFKICILFFKPLVQRFANTVAVPSASNNVKNASRATRIVAVFVAERKYLPIFAHFYCTRVTVADHWASVEMKPFQVAVHFHVHVTAWRKHWDFNILNWVTYFYLEWRIPRNQVHDCSWDKAFFAWTRWLRGSCPSANREDWLAADCPPDQAALHC